MSCKETQDQLGRLAIQNPHDAELVGDALDLKVKLFVACRMRITHTSRLMNEDKYGGEWSSVKDQSERLLSVAVDFVELNGR